MRAKISAGAKSSVATLIEGLTRSGLKFGIPAMVLSSAYLLYLVFGPRMHSLGTMSPDDRVYLHASATTAMTALRIASLVVSMSLALRFFYEPLAGQVMSLAGAGVYFLSPMIFGYFTGGTLDGITTYQEIVLDFSRVGFVALMPGGLLVMRDLGARLAGRVRERRAAMDLLSRRKPEGAPRRRKLYEKCWDMPLCQEFVRKYCPAHIKRRCCWRLKSGCQCDSVAISKAMAAGTPNDWMARSLMEGAEEEVQRNKELTPAQKRARCRRCIIYVEHQRQKHRILSTLVFPAVALVIYVWYDQLSPIAWDVLKRTDRFMSFLTYNPGHTVSFESHGGFLTTLALIWLGIVGISYALRAVEYLIFDLQV